MFKLLKLRTGSLLGAALRRSAAILFCATLALASAPGCSDGKLPDGTELIPGTGNTGGDGENLPRLSFAQSSASADESVSSKVLTVVLDTASADPVTVGYSTIGNATGGGVDYTLSSGTIAFAAGETSKTIDLAISEDSLSELDEIVTVILSSPTNALIGTNGSFVYTILDNDPEPDVDFNLASSAGGEATTPGLVALSMSAVSGRDVTVDYSVTGGTATGGADYTLAGGTLTFFAGETTKDIQIPVVNDPTDEPNETVEITLDAADGAQLGASDFHEYTIVDDDLPPTVEFSLAASDGPESSTPSVLTVTLSNASGNTITVDYAVSGGTATAGGVDFSAPSGTLTFNPGQTSRTIAVTVVDDSLEEANETVIVSLSNPVAATLGTNTAHTFTINDDDRLVSFDLASSAGGEGTTPALLGVSLSGSSALTVSVDYAVSGGTATGGGADYTLASGTLVFSPGETAKDVSIAINDDTIDENDETIIVTLSNAANSNLGATVVHTYTINDDDLPPSVAFDSATSTDGENIAAVSLPVSLSAVSGKTVTVDYAVTGGTATGGGVDVTLASGTLTFLAGDTTKSISGTVIEDLIAEGDETFDVTISNPANASIGATSVHTYTIIDNDPMPAIDFALASSSDAENMTPALLEVELSNPSAVSVTVDYAVTGGTATGGGTDYTLASGTLTFTAGQVSKTISLAIADDALDELDETVLVTLSNAGNGNLGTILVHTYTILDNDPAPTVAYTLATSSGGEATTPATLSVDLSAVSGKTVTVDYAVTGGTATSGGTDYTLAAGTLTFAAGESNKSISIVIVNDAIDEADETIQVALSNPSNATLGAITSHTFTITDDDVASVQFAATSSNGTESATPALLTVTQDIVSTQTITVDYAVTGGTATGGGTDYTLASGTVTFNPGETSKDISLAIVSDLLDEDDETVIVTLSNPSGASLGTNTAHTYTINDDDAAPTVSYDLASSSGAEATTPGLLAVSLSAASGKSVTVDYAVSGGTATGGGTDYTLAAGTLTFTAGQTTQDVSITVVDDTLDEVDETVTVAISNPSNATLGATTSHTYTITDDDAAPTVAFTLATSSGTEATTPALLAVSLSTASAKTITVDYAVSGGTATGGGTDYTLASGTLTFTAGQTSKDISVTIANDTLDEDDETAIVGISNPSNATLGATTSHTYTITDDDASPSVAFSLASSSGDEATTPALLAVTLSAVSGRSVTVNYAVSGGTATGSGTDYTLAAGMLTFTAGQTSQDISVAVVDDALTESSETIIVTLSSPTNSTLGGTTSHTYTITDNDVAPGPTVTFTSTPLATSYAWEATFEFTSLDGGVTFECEINGGGFSSCISPKTYSGLPNTSNTFKARAANAIPVTGVENTYVWTQDAAKSVALHHFDTDTGLLTDSSQYAANLGDTNGSTSSTPGFFAGGSSGARTFVRTSSQYLSAGDHGGFNAAQSKFTIEGQIYITSGGASLNSPTGPFGAGDSMAIASKDGGASNRGWYLHIYRQGGSSNYRLAFAGSTDAGATITEVASTNISLSGNTWYHVAVTFDQGNVAFYLDGVAAGTATLGTVGSAKIYNSSVDLTLGRSTAATHYLGGRIDEFRWSQVVRTTPTEFPGAARYTAD